MNENYDKWNNRYLTNDTPWETGVPHKELGRLLTTYTDKTKAILEIGCGVGTNAIWLAKNGYNVSGCDISDEAIRKAKQFVEKEKVIANFFQLDFMHDYKKISRYPVIFDCAVFHLFSNKITRQKFANYIAEICEDNGLWFNLSCSIDEAENISRNNTVDPPPTISVTQLIEAVEPKFKILEIKRCAFTVDRRPTQGRADFQALLSVFQKR